MARRGDGIYLRSKTWWLRIIAAIGATVMLTSSASAECAWVLWSYYQTKEQGTFRHERAIVRAYDSKRDCEQAVGAEVLSHIRTWKSVYESTAVSPVDPAIVVAKKRLSSRDDDDSMSIHVTCWPLGLEPTSVIGGAGYRQQGAWVMWAWLKSASGRIFWDIMPYAFEAKAQCEEDASKREAEDKKKGNRADRQLICFPAGTDPRDRPEPVR
jgi:hypothetical protein